MLCVVSECLKRQGFFLFSPPPYRVVLDVLYIMSIMCVVCVRIAYLVRLLFVIYIRVCVCAQNCAVHIYDIYVPCYYVFLYDPPVVLKSI